METTSPELLAYFSRLPAPRVDRTKRHGLDEILVLSICAAICGADNFVAIELFGKARESWFRTMLRLPHAIPSHDTLGRVFSALDPEAFRECFHDWVTSLAETLQGSVVAIDGKTLRRSHNQRNSKSAIHMVNAWASAQGISLGQRATDEKSNEITAIPKLLDLLALSGAIVTLDAMGCQKSIATKIIEKEADYVLALKGNQGTLFEEVKEFFDWARRPHADAPQRSFFETTDGEHGRIEVRRYWSTSDTDWFSEKDEWAELRSFAMVEAERTLDGKTSCERRFYLSSLPSDQVQIIAHAIRSHWSVENSLHWVLDVAFPEDDSRIPAGFAAENFSILRQIALNMLKKDKSIRAGVANKRLNAAWDHQYMLKLIAN